MYFSFDEWNVWYQKNQTPHDWAEAPELIEDRYSLLDALTFAGMGMSLINHSDRVRIACLAQIVNVIAPILTERGGRVLRQATFWPFKYLSLYGRGTALNPVVRTPMAETKHGDAEIVYSTAVLDEDGTLTLFCLNIGEEEMPVALDLRSFGKLKMKAHWILCGDDLDAVIPFDAPDRVTVRPAACEAEAADAFSLRLPKLSWNIYRFGA